MSCDQAHFVCTLTPGTLAKPFQLYGFLTQNWCYSHVLKVTALPAISHCTEKLLEPWDFKLSAFSPEGEKNLSTKLFHSKCVVWGKLVSFAGVCFLFNCWWIAKLETRKRIPQVLLLFLPLPPASSATKGGRLSLDAEPAVWLWSNPTGALHISNPTWLFLVHI